MEYSSCFPFQNSSTLTDPITCFYNTGGKRLDQIQAFVDFEVWMSGHKDQGVWQSLEISSSLVG